MPRIGYLLPTREIVASSTSPASAVSRTQSEVLLAAEKAESYGFDSLWVGDSVLAKPRHDPLTTLAAVAAKTEAVDLGTAIYLPTLRHPVIVAQQTATISLLSGGRFQYGVGVGIGPDVKHEYEQLDLPYKKRGSLLNEHLEIVHALWEDDTVRYDGDFFSVENAGIGMTPVTNPSVYIASLGPSSADGFPPTIRERIQTHGDGWIPGQLSPEKYAEGLKKFRKHTDESPDALMYVDILIGNHAQCVKQAKEFYNRYYPDESEATTDDILADAITGSISEVQDQLNQYTDAGVEEFIVRFPSTAQFNQMRSFRQII